jgi:hypothetical protein
VRKSQETVGFSAPYMLRNRRTNTKLPPTSPPNTELECVINSSNKLILVYENQIVVTLNNPIVRLLKRSP